MNIHPDLAVNELVLQRPDALPVLAAAGIDACCGGEQALALAAAHAGLTFEQLLARIEAAGAAPAAGPRACGCDPKPD
jgi:iron-sulfur cluster repair protein YtfE (RIC family)